MNLTQRLKYSLKKEEAAESNVDFEIGVTAPAAKYCCRLRKISYRAYGLFVAWSLEENSFFIHYLAASQQTLGYYPVDSHFYPMLITVFWHS